RKQKNELKYLKDIIIDLEYEMKVFHKKLEHIVEQCRYIYTEIYNYDNDNSDTSDSETELFDDAQLHKCIPKDIKIEKIHESKGPDRAHSHSKKKRDKNKIYCTKEVEDTQPRDYVSSTIDSMPGSQNINDLMDISPLLFADPQYIQVRLKSMPAKPSLQKNLATFIPLYQNITNAESNNNKASHEVLRSYFAFGLWISKRYEFHRKSNPDHTAQG
ncbi:11143_t:CDS:2, partial [Ambispora gerdemannii]